MSTDILVFLFKLHKMKFSYMNLRGRASWFTYFNKVYNWVKECLGDSHNYK